MKSGHIGLLVLELAGNINLVATKASKLYIQSKRSRLFGGSSDILTFLDQKYWSDLGFFGLYGKLEAPGSF